jgi:two-component sensor histidine kinase
MTAKKKDEAKKEEGMLDPRSIETLRASNELLSLFMRHSPVYAYIKSVTPTESRILQASDNYQRMLGSSSLDIVGKTMEDLFPAGFAAKMTADDWAVVVNGSVLQVEKDMDDRSYISIKFPFVQGDKNMLAGYMFDVTERKQAEGSLEKRELLLKEAQEAAHTSNIAERKMAEETLREVEEKLREGEEKLRELEGKLRAGKEKLQAVEGKLREVEGKPQEVEEKLQAIEDKLRKEEEKLQGVEGKLRDGEEKLRAGEGKLRAGEEKLQAVEGKLRKEEEKLQAVEGKPREVEGKLRAGEEKLQVVERKLRDGEEKLQEIEEKLQEVREKLRAGDEKLYEGEGKLPEVENKLQAGEQKLREVDDKLQAGEQKLREVENKLQAGDEKLQEVENKLQAGDEKLREIDEKLQKVEDKLRKDREKPRAEGATPPSHEEKELLREVHNHVKNNMSSIIALIEMQRRTKGKLLGHHGLTDASLSVLENRIESIGLLHERLYQSQNPARVDAQDYLGALVSRLRTSLDVPAEITSTVDASVVALKLDTAVPVGIIVNELVTNAFKYAFPKNQPCSGADKCEITVSLERRNAEYTLTVDDNGVGLPKMPVLAKTSTLGLRLVRMLGVDQLGGKLTVNRTKGTRFILKFNVKE